MTDLIDRQAVIDLISYSIELCSKALDSMTLGGRNRYAVEVERNSLLKLKDDFKLLPAQPEIIRCKDCKWSEEYVPMCKTYYYCRKQGLYGKTEEDFCSHAERREEGDE